MEQLNSKLHCFHYDKDTDKRPRTLKIKMKTNGETPVKLGTDPASWACDLCSCRRNPGLGLIFCYHFLEMLNNFIFALVLL